MPSVVLPLHTLSNHHCNSPTCGPKIIKLLQCPKLESPHTSFRVSFRSSCPLSPEEDLFILPRKNGFHGPSAASRSAATPEAPPRHVALWPPTWRLGHPDPLRFESLGGSLEDPSTTICVLWNPTLHSHNAALLSFFFLSLSLSLHRHLQSPARPSHLNHSVEPLYRSVSSIFFANLRL